MLQADGLQRSGSGQTLASVLQPGTYVPVGDSPPLTLPVEPPSGDGAAAYACATAVATAATAVVTAVLAL